MSIQHARYDIHKWDEKERCYKYVTTVTDLEYLRERYMDPWKEVGWSYRVDQTITLFEHYGKKEQEKEDNTLKPAYTYINGYDRVNCYGTLEDDSNFAITFENERDDIVWAQRDPDQLPCWNSICQYVWNLYKEGEVSMPQEITAV